MAQFQARVEEGHGQTIYDLKFCDFGTPYEEFFATVGSNRATVYRNSSDGGIVFVQAYVDDDKGEVFYSCGWSVNDVKEPILVFAGLRGLIKVANITKQRVVATIAGHGNSVNNLTFHPRDPNLLLTASKDESIRLWNIKTQARAPPSFRSEQPTLSSAPPRSRAVPARSAVRSRATLLAPTDCRNACVPDVGPTPPQVCAVMFAGHGGHHDEVLSIDVHEYGNCFLSSGMDNSIRCAPPRASPRLPCTTAPARAPAHATAQTPRSISPAHARRRARPRARPRLCG